MTDGPFAETKDLIAGFMIIDVDSYERAVELAGELSAAPGAGGKPIHEWLEVRPFMGVRRRPSPSNGRRRGGRGAAAGADPRRAGRPRPPRGGLRDRGGRRAGGADPRRRDVAGPAARRPQGLAHHHRLAPLRRLTRDPTSARRQPRVPVSDEPPPGPDRVRRRHACALLPVRAPEPEPRVGCRADAAGRRRPHHASDRAGLPRARIDDGATDQPCQAHRERRPPRSARRPAHRAQGAVPGVQRGVQRRRRPRRGGDPAGPAAVGDQPTTRRSPGCSRCSCSTTRDAPPGPAPTAASCRWPSRTAGCGGAT